jgi:hypothetical protein
MPFKVSLSFAGLILAAMDERNPSSPRLHLLPMKCVEGNDYHRPSLLYPTSQQQPGQPPGQSELACTDLTNSCIEFSLGTTPLDLWSLRRSHIAPLDRLASTGLLSSSCVSNNSNQVAGARITLFTGEMLSEGPLTWFQALAPAAPWEGQLTTYIEWFIDGVESYDTDGVTECLTICLDTLDSSLPSPSPSTVSLYPTRDGWIRLVLVNALLCETPPNEPLPSSNGDLAHHFSGYFKAFPNTTTPSSSHWPRLAQPGPYPTDWPFKGYTGGCTHCPSRVIGTTLIRPVCFSAMIDVGTTIQGGRIAQRHDHSERHRHPH